MPSESKTKNRQTSGHELFKKNFTTISKNYNHSSTDLNLDMFTKIRPELDKMLLEIKNENQINEEETQFGYNGRLMSICWNEMKKNGLNGIFFNFKVPFLKHAEQINKQSKTFGTEWISDSIERNRYCDDLYAKIATMVDNLVVQRRTVGLFLPLNNRKTLTPDAIATLNIMTDGFRIALNDILSVDKDIVKKKEEISIKLHLLNINSIDEDRKILQKLNLDEIPPSRDIPNNSKKSLSKKVRNDLRNIFNHWKDSHHPVYATIKYTHEYIRKITNYPVELPDLTELPFDSYSIEQLMMISNLPLQLLPQYAKQSNQEKNLTSSLTEGNEKRPKEIEFSELYDDSDLDNDVDAKY